ncbi:MULTISPECIES: hypothetical protein [Nostocales]|jgi:hypothetical protein|uniref:hypothetical protein n=1 Tax=Nostocales TaxID=1161 RepID=UPI00232DDC96|nr:MULTISPECIES: hypothetical protein [Aphanizomenonaceae]MDB9473479.1 hypothetical protein [Dolichospermum circinale CS-537/11]MDB9500050.1 hypothetical protein [Nodularia spumigena CS-336/02]
MTTRTIQQSNRIHAMLAQLGVDKDTKKSMLSELTGGRTSSTKDLSKDEADKFINQLKYLINQMGSDSADVMRKKIIGIAHNMGWQIICSRTNKVVADIERINNWCVKFGKFKKPLNKHQYSELVQLVSQFQNVEKQHHA